MPSMRDTGKKNPFSEEQAIEYALIQLEYSLGYLESFCYSMSNALEWVKYLEKKK